MNPRFIAISSLLISTVTLHSIAHNELSPPRAQVVAFYSDDTLQVPPKERETDVRVVLVSDTHNIWIEASHFPAGDLLLHAGDHTEDGTPEQLERAARWLNQIASQYKYGCVTIAGNHDKPLDTETFGNSETKRLFIGDKITLLNHESLKVAGLTIFGSPYVPLSPKRQKMPASDPMRLQGFNRDDTRLTALYEQIPDNIDILMTHTPAFGLLDTSPFYGGKARPTPIAIGSKVLGDWWSKRRASQRPSLHVFGHEHDSRGFFQSSELGVLFCNTASVNGDKGAAGYSLKPNFRAMVVDFRLADDCEFFMQDTCT